MKPTLSPRSMRKLRSLTALSGSHPSAQGRGGTPQGPLPEGQTNDPFPQPIARDTGIITVTTGVDPAGTTPEEFTKFLKNEVDKWGKVIKAANVKIES